MIEIHPSGPNEKLEKSMEEDNVPRDWYPFDPYALPRSKSFVTDFFLEYAPSDSDEEEMVTDEEDSDQSDGIDDDDM